jgi:hypothetical protein
MDTYFIRHTESIDIDEKTRERIWKERRIAIHFPGKANGKLGRQDNVSSDPDDYSPKRGRKQMRALAELARTGGFVCAEHYGHKRCMLGLVKPKSKIELMRGHWGTRNGMPGKVAVLKTLKLHKIKMVHPTESAAFLAGRPRMGTISPWYSVGKLIGSIVNREVIKPSLELLLPPQQEVMCGEFLRTIDSTRLNLPQMTQLLLPVGGTLRDVDIWGIDENGNEVIAQVTYRSPENCDKKIKALRKHRVSKGGKLILFCKCSKLENRDGVLIVPLRLVYEKFTSTPSGKLWLKHILGLVRYEGS